MHPGLRAQRVPAARVGAGGKPRLGDCALGPTETVRIEWVPGLSMNLDLRFDDLAAIMCLLVLGVGTLVLVYCARYFTSDEPRLGLFAAEIFLRRRDVRPGDRRRHAAALRLLGSDDGAVVPARGAQRRRGTSRRAACRRCWSPPRAGWRCWSASSSWARSPAAIRSPRVNAAGAARLAGRRRDRADSDRRAEQVGARADPFLAARCDGRADPGERLPARRRDGEGRRLPRRAARAGVRETGPWPRSCSPSA